MYYYFVFVYTVLKQLLNRVSIAHYIVIKHSWLHLLLYSTRNNLVFRALYLSVMSVFGHEGKKILFIHMK